MWEFFNQTSNSFGLQRKTNRKPTSLGDAYDIMRWHPYGSRYPFPMRSWVGTACIPRRPSTSGCSAIECRLAESCFVAGPGHRWACRTPKNGQPTRVFLVSAEMCHLGVVPFAGLGRPEWPQGVLFPVKPSKRPVPPGHAAFWADVPPWFLKVRFGSPGLVSQVPPPPGSPVLFWRFRPDAEIHHRYFNQLQIHLLELPSTP